MSRVSSFEAAEERIALSAEPLVILPLGDSIVQGEFHPTSEHRKSFGYRAALQKMLIDEEIDFDFVGSRSERCRETSGEVPFEGFDPDHEGHWGWRTDEILAGRPGSTCGVSNRGHLSEWVNSYGADPDVVLVHVGTNDIIQALPSNYDTSRNDLSTDQVQQIGEDVRSVVDHLVQTIDKEDLTILVAKLIPGSAIVHEVAAVNEVLPNVLAELEQVRIVDHFSDFDPVSMTYDALHPNVIGQQHMADRWLEAILDSQDLDASEFPIPTEPTENALDFDDNGAIDVADVELLQANVRQQSIAAEFDLNNDQIINDDDVYQYVDIAFSTRQGDANLDGVVAFEDFLILLDNYNSDGGWSQGDFDNDGLVGFSDFLVLSRNFGFVSGE